MMAFIKKMLGSGGAGVGGNDFSDFFDKAKSGEKVKVIRRVLREATEEQREVMRKYKKAEPTPTH